ncbi:hypothetical protein EGR_10469 [Echinococcus granulosus]|uniref:Uncharacterized protein n=1 Tax=Echinococcus granulosus TaxID=6210 RepID=W6U0M7_ECHGR|nr:hypothetical protein EGR_10469 [Echinococcus granulosus]EUB54670.1 hypothetical protein EGR_10469 [Echinococcus granulosus]
MSTAMSIHGSFIAGVQVYEVTSNNSDEFPK